MRAIAVVATAVVTDAAPRLRRCAARRTNRRCCSSSSGGRWRCGGAATMVLTAAHGGMVELQPVFMTNIKMTPPTALRRHFDS